MKNFLFALAAVGLSLSVTAQNLTINPVPSYGEDPDNTGTGIAHATLKNDGPEMKSDITWVRTTNDLSPEWYASICDFTYCYSPTTDVAPSFLILDSGESGEVKTNFSTNDYEGDGYVEIQYYSISDSANYNTLGVFIYSAEGTEVGFASPSASNSFEVYPNPAVNDVNVVASLNSNITEVRIINIVGKVMQNYKWNTASGKMVLPVQSISEGIYFVQFMNAAQEVVATKKLSVKH